MAKKAKCVAALLEAFPDINERNAKAMVNELDVINSNVGRAEGALAAKKQMMEYVQRKRVQMSSQIRGRARDIKAIKKAFDFINDESFKGDGAEALKTLLGGTALARKGAANNVATNSKRLETLFSKVLLHALGEDKTLRKLYQSGALDKEIMQEMYVMGNLDFSMPTKNKQAHEIAKAIVKTNNLMRQKLIDAGLDVGFVPNYIMRQSHDMMKVRNVGGTFEESKDIWVNDIKPHLDIEKMFKMKDPPDKLVNERLGEIFDAIVKGDWNRLDKAFEVDRVVTIGNYSNIGRRIEKSRQLHFKSGESLYEYNKKYGKSQLSDSINSAIHYNSRSAALIEAFGPNAQRNFELVKKRMKKELSGDNLDKFNRSEKDINNLYDMLSGTLDRPVSQAVQTFEQAVKTHNVFTLMGSSFLAALTDMPVALSVLKGVTGRNLLETQLDLVNNYIGAVKDKKMRKELLMAIGQLTDDYNAYMMAGARVGDVDEMPGKFAEANRIFFKLNLLGPHTEAAKASSGKYLMTTHQQYSNSKWGGLPEEIRHNFQRANITKDDWEILRRGTQSFSDGTKGLTPEGVKGLDDVDPKLREDVAAKWSNYLMFVVEHAVPTPGARQRNVFVQGTQAGTPQRAALSFLGQFKGFPLAIHQSGNMILSSNPNKSFDGMAQIHKHPGDMKAFAGFLASMVVSGYVSMTIRDMVNNRTPRTDSKALFDAFVRSGAAGLYGDFIMGEYNRHHGRTLLHTAAGPVFSNISNIGELYSKALRGDASVKEAVRLLIKNTPGQNLFYTKTALDQLIIENIYESLQPGYKHRKAQRLIQDTGQEELF